MKSFRGAIINGRDSSSHLVACIIAARRVWIVSLLWVFTLPVTAQQSQSANIALKMSLVELAQWSDYFEPATLSIEIRNINRPSEITKRLTLISQKALAGEVQSIEATKVSSYLIAENREKWFNLTRLSRVQLYLKITDVAWPNDAGTISFKANTDGETFTLVLLQLEPGTYRVLASVRNREGTFTVTDSTQGYAESQTILVSLETPPRLGGFWQKLGSLEGILGATIVALAAILIAVLKDNVKAGFNKLLDLLGKYLGGKLAERRFLKRYLDNLAFNHKYLKLIGFNTAGISRPLLEEVFVSLRIASNVHVGSSQSKTSQDRSAISFNSAFKRYRCMAILGGPGAGKTTTLSYALLAFAQNKSRKQLGVHEQLLPIYVPLRRLSNTNRSIIDDVTDKDTQILSAEILKEYPSNYFEKKLKKGQCLLLLDGLDEVLDERTHREIAERINSLVAAFPRNRFVVTCRTAGWNNLLSGEFEVLLAQDFDRDEIQRFVLGWHKAVITQSEHSKLQLDIPDKKKFEEAWEASKHEFVRPAIDIQSRSLIHAIDSNNRILAIAVNPMLLSLISLVHFNRQFLPRGRTVLYSQCIDLLIDSWDRTRDILSRGTGVTSIQKEAVLREIAFDFQTRGKGEDSRDNLEHLIAAISYRLGISTPSKELLEDIETRSGLLTERSLDVFGFSHLTLQEYLVAKHIQINQSHYGLLEENYDNQGWREVILLHTGLVDDATELITGVASSESLDRQTLAGYCVGDAQHCDSNVAQRVIDRLLSELSLNNNNADDLVNVIAAIAADFNINAVTVEERLSAHLIDRINDDSSPKSDRLNAVAVLGRARVTRALKSLIGLLNNTDEAMRREAIKAIILFGDLALPKIEEALFPSPDPEYMPLLIEVLSEINTGASARLLLKLYDLNDAKMDLLISGAIGRMMTNTFVEAELLELDDAQLPSSLRHIPLDRNGWSYKAAHSGFWLLDTKLRGDVLRAISDSPRGSWNGPNDLSEISFPVLFPAFLSYLRSLPKARVRSKDEQVSENFTIFEELGFDKSEPNKLYYLVNQIQTQFEMPLDLALQRIGSPSTADYARGAPKATIVGVWIAKAYFVLFYVNALFFAFIGAALVFETYQDSFKSAAESTEIIGIFSITMFSLVFYLSLILVTKRKLKKGFLSKQFAILIAFPIWNFMQVLPYITKQKPWIKLLSFQVLILCLSPFSLLIWELWFLQVPISALSLNAITLFALTSPFLFVPLSILYWKYRVLAQNPVYELITLHPQGRKLIGETT